MSQNHGTALVDWGTSNLRVWLMGKEEGVLGHITSPLGADKLPPGQFYGVLKTLLLEMGVEFGHFERLPVVICGMAGARQGWAEAPYLPVSARCQNIPDHSIHIPTEDLDVHIMPGLCVRELATPDVMRGEETQLLGLYMQAPDFSGVFCMPGTHSKWGVMQDGVIQMFQTAMTGELFSLLSRQSVIRHVVGEACAVAPECPAFQRAVLDGYYHPEQLVFSLFPVRAGGLLFSATGMEAAARLSGLLIGAELSSALKKYHEQTQIALIASGKLQLLYAQAFKYVGRACLLFDADDLVQKGLMFAAKKIFGGNKAVP